MVDGLWTVQFQGPQGPGGGVAVFTNGKVLGGDAGYTYQGTYEENNNNVTARIRVANFSPGVPNVMGAVGDFDLEIRGAVAGNTVNATGTVPGQPGQLRLTLTKKSAL
jgi:hypothetical protein